MIRIAASCLIAGMSTGCASIVNGNNQSVSVTTRSQGAQLAGATCKLTNDKGEWYALTPGSVTIRRSYNDLAVDCAYDGLDAGITNAKSTTKGMVFGNLIFGGVIGAGIDIASGAAYDYPNVIHVDMGKASAFSLSVVKTVSLASPIARSAPEQQPLLQAAPTVPTPVVVTAISGVYGLQAERLTRKYSCGAPPKLVAKGSDFETYSVACFPGDPMMLRCEGGSCREMK